MGLSARDVMEREIVTVDPDETLADLERLLLQHRIGGVPVVEEGTLLGIVSRSDLVRVLSTEQSLADTQLDFYRQYEEHPTAPSELVAREMEEDREDAARIVAHRMAGLRVRDAMIDAVVRVEADAPLRDVARTLVEQRIHRLVVTENQRPVGIITTLDLVRLIADERVA
jgi:CBS domain-containing protein